LTETISYFFERRKKRVWSGGSEHQFWIPLFSCVILIFLSIVTVLLWNLLTVKQWNLLTELIEIKDT